MYRPAALAALFSALASSVSAQQVGTNTAETHPALTWYKCTSPTACTAQNGKIVLDANWRWTHSTTGYTNCYTGNAWDSTLAPDDVTCAKNCALDGADYSGTYGITTSGNALTLKFVTPNSNGKNVGSRVYLMSDDTHYNVFKMLGQEISFDVELSSLPCGLNGAVYFSEMDADGGMSKYPNNKAGAKYGTGYCDSQCPRDLKFINGECNAEGWTGTSDNSGTGKYGSCCNEMDLWEANAISAAYTPHPCDVTGQTRCTGDDCGQPSRYSGVCDPDGCDFNSYRQGDHEFYGPGKTVDTNSKFTIITQFITDNGSSTGKLVEIKRFYIQNGNVIPNSVNTISGIDAVNSITDSYCDQQKAAFGDTTSFQNHGGLAKMGESLGRGGVLVLSVWDDYVVNMLWLDSTYPTDCTKDGCFRGTCPTTSGVPSDIESSASNAKVTYSNIKVGPVGSTYNTGGGSTSTTSRTSTTSTRTTSTSTRTTTTSTRTTSTTRTTTTTTRTTTAGPTQTHYGQCGGQGYSGPTQCASPYTCQYSNPWYSQCL
jgi:cellulose 1,4-beta-cellobiosidase